MIENVVSYGFDRFCTQPLHLTSRIVSREGGEIDLSHTLQQPCCLPLLLYTSTSSNLRTTSLHSTQILHGILSNPRFVVRKHRNPLVGESGRTLVRVPAQGLVLCRNLDIRTLDMIRLQDQALGYFLYLGYRRLRLYRCRTISYLCVGVCVMRVT